MYNFYDLIFFKNRCKNYKSLYDIHTNGLSNKPQLNRSSTEKDFKPEKNNSDD